MDKANHHLSHFSLHRLLLQTMGRLTAEEPIGSSLTIPGLIGPAHIEWNAYRVPTIRASTLLDAIRIEGYTHGRMRAFQMDFLRRMPAGELAELLGPSALPYDTFMRKLNLREYATVATSRWTAETESLVHAYVEGVNEAFFHSPPAPEYRLLQLTPRPWDATDCSLLVYFLSWALNSIWTRKWAYEVFKADETLLEWLFGDIPGTPAITIIPQTGHPASWGATGIGSNNWVVSGEHTIDGHPLLANDPHLAPQLPSIWFQMRVMGGPLDVSGVSLPGCPGIVIGQNSSIAWGVTNVDPDCQDLYRIHMQDDQHYLLDGRQVALQSRQEEIRIHGQASTFLTCETSHAGPIIYRQTDGTRIALNWTGFTEMTTLNSALSLNLATNWSEFIRALEDWTVPAQNFVYADREGNIGYLLAGLIPTHENGPALGFLDGNESTSQWAGRIPYSNMPRLFNPQQGYIISANNAVQGVDSEPRIPAHNSLGYRAKRIQTLLEAQPLHDVESFANIQQDIYSEPLDRLAQRLVETPSLPISWKPILKTFNGEVRDNSVAPTLLYLWSMAAVPTSVNDSLNTPFFDDLIPGAPGSHPFPENFWSAMSERLVPILLDRFDSLLHDIAFKRAHHQGIAVFGKNISEWTWGKAHITEAFHPFVQVPMTRPIFGRQPMPTSGDFYTPYQAAFPIDPNLAWPRSVTYLPSLRQILLPHALERSQFIHLTGQSGHPLSLHYDDMMTPYRSGQTFPLGQIEQITYINPIRSV